MNGIDRVIAAGARFSASRLTVKGGDAGANPAHSSEGGGIYAFGTKFSLDRVVVRNNEAVFGGGLELFTPETTIEKTTIKNNNADEGGGANVLGINGSVPSEYTIRASTISGNFSRKGAGVLADGNQPNSSVIEPDVNMINSTVAGNQAAAEGGGILADNGATMTLRSSTVAYNMANSDSTSPNGGFGGGIVQHSGAVFNLTSSLLASNTVGAGGTNPQCDGTFGGDGGSVIAPGTITCSFISATQANDPLTGTLADNGGPTETVELLAGSPAIGAALDCPPPAGDQRGRLRPTNCDSGAFEKNPRR